MDFVVHRYELLDSTQDKARRLLTSGEAFAGHVVLADAQRAGRGRFGRAWISPSGGFYATFLLRESPLPSIRAGLAAVRTLRTLGLKAQLKWPNDVLVGERKLAGILVETKEDVLLVGFGINLALSPLPTATSLAECGVEAERDVLLERIGRELHGILSPKQAIEAIEAYRSCCATLGRAVRIRRADGTTVEGRAVDVDGSGSLLVETVEGLATISSGECEHVVGGS